MRFPRPTLQNWEIRRKNGEWRIIPSAMKIQSIRLKNFKMFKDVVIRDIPPLAVFVGANGSGKSTLFDVFGFLRDTLTYNAQIALRMNDRGGFGEMRTRNEAGPIEIELKFRAAIKGSERLITYAIAIQELNGAPIIEEESLSYKRGRHGKPFKFLDFRRGRGQAVADQDFSVPDIKLTREEQSLDSPQILAIKGLGQFEKFAAASAFRQFIENWHLSNFHISAARPSQRAGLHERLSEQGDNLAEVAKFLSDNHQKSFDNILTNMARRVPGVSDVRAEEMPDGRVLLKFHDGAWKDPFAASHVSDGTIKMFAYLVLLNSPMRHSLLCVEEPENQLYPSLLNRLLEEFRLYAGKGGGQVFVSTHSPDLLNAAKLDEVFWLEKKRGIAIVHRASENKTIEEMVEDGDVLGRIWRTGLFEGANPR